MSWQCGQQTVAEPISAEVTGTPMAGGVQVHINVRFRLFEWPWNEKGPVSLVPQPCEVTACLGQNKLSLGFALPNPADVILPSRYSSSSNVRFALSLSTPALVALEAARDGGPLEFVMTLVAHPFAVEQNGHAPGIRVLPTSEPYRVPVSKEIWIGLLKDVGFCDSLLTELRLPSSGPEATAQARQRLVKAVQARNEGSYDEVLRRSRIALDELKTAGFGGKAPADVAKFLQAKSNTMSQAERFSALLVALHLFLSSSHHNNTPDEYFTREDADLAIAMTAALLRLAPRWETEPKEVE